MLKKSQIMFLTLLLGSVSAMAGTVTYRSLANGAPLGTSFPASGTNLSLGAQNPIMPNGVKYTFLFWITPCDNPGTNIQSTPCTIGPNDSMTAWYGEDCTTPCPGIDTIAFSVSNNATIPGTPIASVVPANLWVPGSNNVQISSTVPATITAQSVLDQQNFDLWLQPFGGGSATGASLVVPATKSDFSIAFYKAPPLPLPPTNPCFFFEREEGVAINACELQREGVTSANIAAECANLSKIQALVGKCEACAKLTNPTQQAKCLQNLEPNAPDTVPHVP